MKFDLLQIIIEPNNLLIGLFRIEIKKKVFVLFALQRSTFFKVLVVFGIGIDICENIDGETEVLLILFSNRYYIKITRKEK